MRKQPSKKTSSIAGYLLFFITIAVTVTIALTLFMFVNRKTEGNTLLIAIAMLVIIVALSAVCTGIDIWRRRVMIDKPVSKILSATERIASGDFSVRLTAMHSYEKTDDYDLIMENLNAMAAELEKSEVLKTDFISNVSHELKTPLAVIQSYVTLLQGDLEKETRAKYAQTVLAATKRLSNLITNILRLNKLENQQLNIAEEVFPLHEALAEAVFAVEELCERKNIELECDFDEITARSSVSYLELIWNNLLSNAVKFTEEGGKITVTLRREGANAVLSVSDTGCGISPEIGAHIFDKFYQGDTSHSQEGNGLGLALVKKVVDVIGGEISVRSQVRKGSTFTVTLKGVVDEE